MSAQVAQAAHPAWYQVAFRCVRPATLWAAWVPVMVGTAVAASEGHWLWDVALACLSTALFLQIGTNLVNDYADFEKGADNAFRKGPARGVQSGWVTPEQLKVWSVVVFVCAALSGLYVCAYAGWWLMCVGLAAIAAGYMYTAGPWPLAYLGLGDVVVFCFFGPVAVAGTYYVQTGHLTVKVMLVACMVGAWATALLVVNNLRDRDTDRLVGKKTWAVRWGGTYARVEYALLLGLSYVLLGAVGVLWKMGWGWYVPFLSLPWAMGNVVKVWHCEGVALNPLLGSTARLELVFGGLLAVGVLL
jgi:1,4-dihydroxy-2-naphthoate octaprenyltransferase